MGGKRPLASWLGASLALHLLVAAAWLAVPPAPQMPTQARHLALEILDGGETQASRATARPASDATTPPPAGRVATRPPAPAEPQPRRAEAQPTKITATPTPAGRDSPQAPAPAEPQPRRAEARTTDTMALTEMPPVGRASARQTDAREPSPPAARPPDSRPAAAAQAPRRAAETHIAERLQAQLLERLAEQLRYPPLARARGWEGVVLMQLRLEANGDISRLRVLESSGYPLLDRAASQGLQRVARLPQAIAWLQGEAFELILPVQYRLIDL